VISLGGICKKHMVYTQTQSFYAFISQDEDRSVKTQSKSHIDVNLQVARVESKAKARKGHLEVGSKEGTNYMRTRGIGGTNPVS